MQAGHRATKARRAGKHEPRRLEHERLERRRQWRRPGAIAGVDPCSAGFEPAARHEVALEHLAQRVACGQRRRGVRRDPRGAGAQRVRRARRRAVAQERGARRDEHVAVVDQRAARHPEQRCLAQVRGTPRRRVERGPALTLQRRERCDDLGGTLGRAPREDVAHALDELVARPRGDVGLVAARRRAHDDRLATARLGRPEGVRARRGPGEHDLRAGLERAEDLGAPPVSGHARGRAQLVAGTALRPRRSPASVTTARPWSVSLLVWALITRSASSAWPCSFARRSTAAAGASGASSRRS